MDSRTNIRYSVSGVIPAILTNPNGNSVNFFIIDVSHNGLGVIIDDHKVEKIRIILCKSIPQILDKILI